MAESIFLYIIFLPVYLMIFILVIVCENFFVERQQEKKCLIVFSKNKKYMSNKYCNMGIAKDLSCIKIFEKNKNPRKIITIYTFKNEAPKIWNLFCSVFNEHSDIAFWKNLCLKKQISIKETVEDRNNNIDNYQTEFFEERNIDI